MNPPTRRESKPNNPNSQLNTLPLRYENKRFSEKFESRYNNRNSFGKNLNQSIDAKVINNQDLSYTDRSIPVEGKLIIKETYLSSDGESEESSFRVTNAKTKVVQKPIAQRIEYHRSKSTIVEKPRIGSFVEDKTQIIKAQTISTSIPIVKSPEVDVIKDNTDIMIQTALLKKESENLKTMEARRIPENDNNFLPSFNQTINVQNKPKSGLSKLISRNAEGEEEFFEGTLIKGLKSGFCRIIYSSFVFKEGYFLNGQLEGEGTIKYPNGVTVNGIFRNNNLHSHILLSIDSATYSIDYVDGEYHNDQIFVNEKSVIYVTVKACENIFEYTGKVKIYFRNFYKLDCIFEKGVISELADSVLYDKFENSFHGRIRHGINAEINGIFIFKPLFEPENEYLLLFKGEGKVVRKHKK